MKKLILFFVLIIAFNEVIAQEITYRVTKQTWNTDSLGMHRVVLDYTGTGSYAKATIPWRRNDDKPTEKRIILEDAQTHQKINNYKIEELTNEVLKLVFEPSSKNGKYYIYYLPSKNKGSANYPKNKYWKPEQIASANWLNQLPSQLLINTKVDAIESIDEFNSFYPMEVIATAKETQALIKKSGRNDYLVIPEDRLNPIRMKNYLPAKWTQQKFPQKFSGKAYRNENYNYQLGVYALQDLEVIKVLFSDLKSANGKIISSKNNSCLNTEGVDYRGKSFSTQVNIARGEVQALWCLLNIPQNASAGIYTGTVQVQVKNAKPTTIPIRIEVSSTLVKDKGINEAWKQTRLQWLNSTLVQNNQVIAPYTPLQLSGNTISLLGRKIQLDKTGFPAQIQTYFTEEMTGTKAEPNNILTEPIHFHIIKSDNQELSLKPENIFFKKQSEGTITWTNRLQNDFVKMEIEGSVEFDGYVTYQVKLIALQDVELKNITLHIPFAPEATKYLMGLGYKGQQRPEKINWKWDVARKNQDGVWLGNVNMGLQYTLRDEHYIRPLNTNFYLQKPLLLPTSWGNDNKGGIDIGLKGKSILADNYSGARSMKKGDILYYDFNLLITPFHTINTDFQWTNRFYHKYDNLQKIKEKGATVINIHHATPINPWINYPFIEYRQMKSYIDSAHTMGLKVKIYNTVRELSNHAYETFPLRSLGHEIYSAGKGGGFSWLQEHLGKDYIAAWFVPQIQDAAIVNSGMSRWHNYYVEGMNWLTQNVGIDGIYLDDVAFDRVTMKRIKSVLTADKHPGIIDLHSANQFNKSDGFINSAMLYMEHFPYLNRLWFGEYFDYEKNNPDFYLTEVSGIPFGLMGEMLQDGGNAWRGMLYGMTNRMPWTKNADPSGLWQMWDEFGMQGSQMIGYWVSSNPVKTSSDEVKATIYKKEGKTMIALASWAKEDVMINLDIDWKSLAIDSTKATLKAKAIKNFQDAAQFKPTDKISIMKGKGLLLILE